MGCDIHTAVEVLNDEGKWVYKNKDWELFDIRCYGLFGFLADVRNYSAVPPISPARGLPDDLSETLRSDEISRRRNIPMRIEDWLGDHSYSWLSLKELLDFDYDRTFEDRRYTKQVGPNSWDGGATADKGCGVITTFREFLPDGYFNDLEKLKAFGAPDRVRVVFGFDS